MNTPPERPYLRLGFAMICVGVLVPLGMIWWMINDTMRMPDITAPPDALGEKLAAVSHTRDMMPLVFGAYAIGGIGLAGGAILSAMGLIQFNHRMRRER